MYIVTPEQMREADRAATEQYGIPSLLLMEYAAEAVTEELLNRYPLAERFLILCGGGNNGGDGYAVARRLLWAGKKPLLMEVMPPKTEDAKANALMAKKAEIPFVSEITGAEVIVDAILGTGSLRPFDPPTENLVQEVNTSGLPVIAIDHPSGVDAENGTIPYGTAVKADVTIVLAAPKTGTFSLAAPEHFGEIVIKDIHLPVETESPFRMAELRLPDRLQSGHKGTFGSVLAICGSTGMTGAAVLSANAALKAGCGRVTLALPKQDHAVAASQLTEVMTRPLEQNEVPEIKADVTLFGCGVGISEESSSRLRQLLQKGTGHLIIDADGITCLAKEKELLLQTKYSVTITPHIGEMARFCGITAEEVQQNWLTVAQKTAQTYNITVVLKSCHTAIASPDGEVRVFYGGNDGMATAGSGDVLAGTIAGLYAQGGDAESGVILHAEAGDIAYAELGFGLTAGDILRALPKAIHSHLKGGHTGERTCQTYLG